MLFIVFYETRLQFAISSIHVYVFTRYQGMVPKFLLPIAVWCAIQVMKVIIDLIAVKELHRNALRSAGWFPSVHSWIAASITTVMLFEHGIDSTAFALAFCFSFLFWYDAANVRYEAGQHAKFLKKIGEELGWILDIWTKTPLLKERLGHTFFEVLWWIIIGAWLTVVFYWLWNDLRTYFTQ